jgi:hypothetical protein
MFQPDAQNSELSPTYGVHTYIVCSDCATMPLLFEYHTIHSSCCTVPVARMAWTQVHVAGINTDLQLDDAALEAALNKLFQLSETTD